MPTPNRTTIKAAVTALVDQLRAGLIADPPTPAAPFRRIAIGTAESDRLPRPLMTTRVARTRSVDVVDDDRLVEVTLELRITIDVDGDDAMSPLLDRIGAVDDYLDSLRDTGVMDGADGFDDRAWTVDEPKAASGTRVATATGTIGMVVRVKREENREGI